MIKSCNFTGLFLTGTKLETTDISDLLPLLVNHDHKAFSRLYEDYGRVLFGLLYYIVKDEQEAENLLQDTFVKIWKKICDYDNSKGAFFTWITSIARNTAIDYLRSRKNMQRSKTQTLEDYVPVKGTENPAQDLEIKDMKALVKKLEPKYQEVIELVYFLGYTHQEASERLQIQLGTLKTRSRIAIRELKKMI
ncbi:MAG: RNA polymerase sigma factor [Saprospiraceae bacterium]